MVVAEDGGGGREDRRPSSLARRADMDREAPPGKRQEARWADERREGAVRGSMIVLCTRPQHEASLPPPPIPRRPPRPAPPSDPPPPPPSCDHLLSLLSTVDRYGSIPLCTAVPPPSTHNASPRSSPSDRPPTALLDTGAHTPPSSRKTPALRHLPLRSHPQCRAPKTNESAGINGSPERNVGNHKGTAQEPIIRHQNQSLLRAHRRTIRTFHRRRANSPPYDIPSTLGNAASTPISTIRISHRPSAKYRNHLLSSDAHKRTRFRTTRGRECIAFRARGTSCAQYGKSTIDRTP